MGDIRSKRRAAGRYRESRRRKRTSHPGSSPTDPARAAVAPAAILALALTGCVPQIVSDVLAPRDLTPPGVTAWDCADARELRIDFDEEVGAAASDFALSPNLGALELETDGCRVLIRVQGEAAPGTPLALEGRVRDAAGNSTAFVLPFWAYNPRLPRIVINEALTQGTAAHPDAVELRALEAGNLAGLTFYVGSAAHKSLRFIFPSCEVFAGEFIVLHLKPEGLAEEVDEIDDAAASGGLDSSGARDFWYRPGVGALPGENGALSLYRSPTGCVRDALLYSARTSESDTKYGGFGTQALYDQARDLAAAGAWSVEGSVRPEDAARSEGATSTRTLCRSSDSQDTESAADWHVVPTKGSSLGTINTDSVYAP